MFEQFSENIKQALTCQTSSEMKQLISKTLAYVGRQNPEFQNNYIRFFIDDISSAYEFNPEIPDLSTASCAKGIKERIVMCLKSATLGQTEAYQPLLQAFIHKIPIYIMQEFTSACIKDPRLQELFNAKPEPTIDEKVRILANCIREKLKGTDYFPQSKGAEEIPDPPELTEYISNLKHGFEGGRKTKRKKTKKNKKLNFSKKKKSK